MPSATWALPERRIGTRPPTSFHPVRLHHEAFVSTEAARARHAACPKGRSSSYRGRTGLNARNARLAIATAMQLIGRGRFHGERERSDRCVRPTATELCGSPLQRLNCTQDIRASRAFGDPCGKPTREAPIRAGRPRSHACRNEYPEECEMTPVVGPQNIPPDHFLQPERIAEVGIIGLTEAYGCKADRYGRLGLTWTREDDLSALREHALIALLQPTPTTRAPSFRDCLDENAIRSGPAGSTESAVRAANRWFCRAEATLSHDNRLLSASRTLHEHFVDEVDDVLRARCLSGSHLPVRVTILRSAADGRGSAATDPSVRLQWRVGQLTVTVPGPGAQEGGVGHSSRVGVRSMRVCPWARTGEHSGCRLPTHPHRRWQRLAGWHL
jgi:hypothetical protein